MPRSNQSKKTKNNINEICNAYDSKNSHKKSVSIIASMPAVDEKNQSEGDKSKEKQQPELTNIADGAENLPNNPFRKIQDNSKNEEKDKKAEEEN